MGNSESSNPVRNMDKRTARREYKEDFINAIQRYRRAYTQSHPIINNQKNQFISWEDNRIRVFARKRPIFQHEIESDEYDVVTCHNQNIIIHDARMHNDMKRQFLNHHEFEFDAVFSEQESNQTVYEVSTKPLVEIACEGGFSTALVYGQTGSGKTFTMTYMYSQAAEEIFTFLHNKIERFGSAPIVSVSFIEIAGDRIHDLLNAFTPTQLRTGGDGSVHAFPVTEPRVNSKDDLMAIIQHGLNIRTTAATGVHDSSSRSHAILKIYIQRTDIKKATGEIVEGTLTLVDLAGSEHRIDSIFHLPTAKTIIIATVSPASKDTEHSLNTLRHACIMHGQDGNGEDGNCGEKETRFVTGGKVTTEQIGEINISRIARKNHEKKKQNNGLLPNELKTNNGNQIETKLAKAANKEIEITDKMKRKMRRLSENKSFITLNENIQQLLRQYRERLGHEERQYARLQVGIGSYIDQPVEEQSIEDENEGVEGLDSDEEVDVEDEVDTFHASIPKAEGDSRLKPSNQLLRSNSTDSHQSLAAAATTSKHLKTSNHHHLPSQRSSNNDFAAALYDDDDFENYTPRSSINNNVNDVKPNVSHKPVILTPGKKSSSDGKSQYNRVPFEKIYESIFIAKDSVPLAILLMQLRAMLKVHHYAHDEIEQFIQKELKGGNRTAAAAAAAAASSSANNNNNRSSTPRTARPTTPQRPASGRISSSNSVHSTEKSKVVTPSADRNRINRTPNRRLSTENISNNNPRSRMSESDTETYSSNADNNSNNKPRNRDRATAPVENRTNTNTNTTNPTTSNRITTNNIAPVPTLLTNPADKDKEEKLLAAKLQLEQEALQRKARQDAAKQIRSQNEQQKVNQVLSKQQQQQQQLQKKKIITMAKFSQEEENLKKLQKEIEEHQYEVHRLNQVLENDQITKNTEEKLSMAQRYGVKKQLALHKAAILKAERKKTEPSSSSEIAAAGSEDPYSIRREEIQPLQRRSLSREDTSSLNGNSALIDFEDIPAPVPVQPRSASGINAKYIEARSNNKSIRISIDGNLRDEKEPWNGNQGDNGNGNGQGNNLRYYGTAGGSSTTKRPGWNFDLPTDNRAFSSDSSQVYSEQQQQQQQQQNDRSVVDSEELPLISERGRPLSLRMAQQQAAVKRGNNPPQPYY